MSQVTSHATTGESQSVSKGKKLKILLQKHASFTSHKLSLHTHSQGLTWQECQPKDEAPHLGASLQLLGFFHPNLNGLNPTYKVWPPTPHTMTIVV